MIGTQPTKNDLDQGMTRILVGIREQLRNAAQLKYWLDQKQDSELTAMGYTSGEVAIIKSAFTDMNTLNNIFSGTANLTTAYDFRTFIRQIWGTGGAY